MAEVATIPKTHSRRFPNESKEYRQARERLLEAERELRDHVEEVAALRRKVNGPKHPDTLRAMLNLAETREGAGRRSNMLAGADDLEVGVVRERLRQVREALAVAGQIDARAICGLFAHLGLPLMAWLRFAALTPSIAMDCALSTSSGLSVALETGRSCSVQPSAFFIAHQIF